MNVAVVTAAMRSGERGGAEALYAGLVGAIRAAGHNVTALEIPIDESNFESVLASYSGAMTWTPALSTSSSPPRHRPTWCGTRAMSPTCSIRFACSTTGSTRSTATASETLRQQRRLIHQLDKAALAPVARARSLRQRPHDLRAPVRRRLVVAAGALYGPAPSARARRIPAASTRRVRLSSRPAASMEARGPRDPGVQAAQARHPAR